MIASMTLMLKILEQKKYRTSQKINSSLRFRKFTRSSQRKTKASSLTSKAMRTPRRKRRRHLF